MNEATNLTQQPLVRPSSSKVRTASIVLTTLLGGVFLLSSGLKALDMTTFAVQISYYGIFRDPLFVRILSLFFIGLEAGLAAALLARIQLRRIVLPALFLLLVGFSGLIGWAWATRNIQDCGCFGKYLPMGPGASIVKNLVLIVFVSAAWVMERQTTASSAPVAIASHPRPPLPLRYLANFGRGDFVAITFVVLVACSFMGLGVGMAFDQLKGTPSASPDPVGSPASSGAADTPAVSGPVAKLAQFNFENKGATVDTRQGEWIVALLSDSCEECAGEVKLLNSWGKEKDAPHIAAFILGEQESYERFESELKPNFPTRLIPALEFFDLIGDAPPRFYYLRNGQAVKYWDEDLSKNPEVEKEIRDAIVKSRISQ
jgi:hypothetical protein